MINARHEIDKYCLVAIDKRTVSMQAPNIPDSNYCDKKRKSEKMSTYVYV